MTFSELIAQETRDLPPWQAGRKREKLLAEGLRRLAKLHGITFREPLQIDANGEFALVASGPDDGPCPVWGAHPCGEYGESFATLLNKHSPRTGIRPTKHMHSKDGWCRINHFDVERMLNEGLA